MESNELVISEKLDVLQVFTVAGSIDALITDIEAKAKDFIPTVNTDKGRKQIASMSHKVSRSKVVLDNLGKNLVADWKNKAKQVDESRKIARDRLDALRDEIRLPLTKWEQSEAERVLAEKLAKEIETAHELAIAENGLFIRQREIEAKEAEIARAEEARIAAEEAAKVERERSEREELMKQEAALEAKKKAEAEAQARIDEAERKEREAKEAAERAAEKAKIAMEEAVRASEMRAKEEAERVKREKLQQESERKSAEEKRQKDVAHRASVNSAAVSSLAANGFTFYQAKQIVTLIAKGKIKHITVNY
jgi:membrane protein involved in colicin uptake